MNIRLLMALALGLAGMRIDAQVGPADRAAWKPDEVGGNHRTWSVRSEDGVNAPAKGGAEAVPKGRIIEIATGMNYWDGQAWVPSVAKFEITESGFEATRMQHVVSLHGNLNRVGSVSVETHDGVVLHSTPVAIGLYDAASGESLIIARINNSVGVRVADNKVFYENAFVGLNGEGLCADVLYTIEPSSFEQDVIIRGKLDPEAYGFPKASARIQIYTEFYEAPQPQRIRRPIRVEDRERVRVRMAKPDLVDEVLGFGEFVLATGRAFPSDAMSQIAAAPVAKEFLTRDQRTFLIETVEYASVQKHFEQLPPCDPQNAAVKRRPAGGRREIDYALIPAASPRSGTAETFKVDENAVRMATANYRSRKGVVIDFIATVGGTINTATVFQGDTTYFVSGAVICNGAATIEGGAVFKFKHQTVTPVGSASIKFNSTVTCKTSTYRPAIFTAVDDDTVGETMNGVSGSGYQPSVQTDGYANPAVWLNNLSSQQLSHLRFTYCQEAVRVEGGSANALSHAQLVKCIRGIVIAGGGGSGSSGCSTPITVNNGLFANVSSPVMSQRLNSTANFFHCTVHSSPAVSVLVAATASSACNFFNSILANITSVSTGPVAMGGSKNGFHSCPSFGTLPVTSASNPFQSPPVGAGNYYLVAGSSFRDAGTTVGISSSLLTELSKRTVNAPTELSGNSYPSGVIFNPQVAGDTGIPDLGYHYPILDYLASQLVASGSGAPIILTNGVAMALYGNFGFSIPDAGQISTEGKAAAMNRLVWYPSVQEQPTLLGGVATRNSGVFNVTGASSTTANTVKPIIRMRFTELAMQGLRQKLFYSTAFALNLNTVSIGDCWLEGVDMAIGPHTVPFPQITVPTVTLFNNLLERSSVNLFNGRQSSVDSPLAATFHNNLFWQTALTLTYNDSSAANHPAWTIQANLFDNATIAFTGDGNFQSLVSRSFQAFFQTPTSTQLGGSGNVSLTALTYATGPNGGPWYIGSSTPTLSDADTSRTGGPAGLYHYTIRTTQVKEQNSNVDIGFHYVATTAGGVPLDTDGDGLPDHLEDVNGNGQTDGTEKSWANPVITMTAGAMQYAMGWPTQLLDSAATITDVDALNFNGGKLTVTITGNATPDDRLTIRNWSMSPNQIGTSGQNITLGGTVIGTFSGGSGGSPLVCNFTSPLVTAGVATLLLRHISYHNVQATIPVGTKTVQIVLNDGPGTEAGVANVTRTISVNKCPQKVDLMFLMDASMSLTVEQFTDEKACATQMVKLLNLVVPSSSGDRFGLVKFCGPPNNPVEVVTLGTSEATAKTLIHGIQRCDGTQFHQPITMAVHSLSNAIRPDAVQLILLMTDGEVSPNDEPTRTAAKDAANRAKAMGMRVITVGVGNELDEQLLQDMALRSTDAVLSEATVFLPSVVTTLAAGFCRDNHAPAVSITGPTQISFGQTATLTGTVTDDGIPEPSQLTSDWALISGPGAVTLTPAPGNPLQVTASFTQPGTFEIRLSASDSVYSGSGTHTVTVTKANVAPTVNAGPNQAVEIPTPVYLAGVATDDGVPVPANLSTVWTVIQGSSSAVTIENATSPTTMVSFSASGTYGLRLTGNDGAVSSFDDVTVVVTASTQTWTFNNVNYVSAGVGGLRGTPEPRGFEGGGGRDTGGSGIIKLNGVSGTVIKALLCWHGPTGVPNPDANAHVLVNGKLAVGRNMGQASDNGWGITAEFLNSRSYVADVTSMVKTWGNGTYEVSGLFKAREVDINGASLVVVYDNPALARTNVVIVAGNDSNNGQDDGVYYRGDVRSIQITNDHVIAGGAQLEVYGLGGYGVLEFGHNDGTVTPPTSSSEQDAIVNAVALHPWGKLMAGSFVEGGVLVHNRLKLRGLITSQSLVANGEIRAIAVQPDGKVVVGGSFTEIGGAFRSRIARFSLDPSGFWTVDPNFDPQLSVNDTVHSIVIRQPTGGPPFTFIYLGGAFSSVNGSSRSGVAGLDSLGLLTSYAQSLSFGYPVKSLAMQPDGQLLVASEGAPSGVRRVNADGTLFDPFNFTPGITHPASVVCHQFDGRILIAGTHQDGPYLARLLASGAVDTTFGSVTLDQPVKAIAEYGNKIVIGGAFERVNEAPMRGIARLLSNGSIDTAFAPNKSGFLNAIPAPAYSGSGAWIELHTGDGQHIHDNGVTVPLYEDYDLHLNGLLWVPTGTQPICQIGGGVIDQVRQIFAGTSVPLRHVDDCLANQGLWDIRAFPVDPSHLANSPQQLVISSPPVGDSLDSNLREDAVSIVLKTLLYPSTGPSGPPAAVTPRLDGPPFAVRDNFGVRRDIGRKVLHVLENDWSVDGRLLRIIGITSPTHGRAEVIYGDSAIAYTASDTFTGVDQFTYTVSDTHGNEATAVVQVTVDNATPAVQVTSSPIAGNLEATDRLSHIRGGGQRADFYRLSLLARQTLCISRSSGVDSHFYLLNSYGELVASGSHADAGIVYLVPDTGDYTLEVTSHDVSGLGAYNLAFSVDTCGNSGGNLIRIYAGSVRVDRPDGEPTVFDFGIEPQQEFTIVNESFTTTPHLFISTTPENSTFFVSPVYHEPLPPGGRATVVVSRSPITQASGTLHVTPDSPGALTTRVTLSGSGVAGAGSSVTITDPKNNAVYTHPASVQVNVTASPATGNTIAKVELFAIGARGRIKVDEATQPSGSVYKLAFTSGASGTHDLVASMIQANGARKNSAPVRIGIASGTGNSSPVAVSDTVDVAVGAATRINVLANDFDADGDPIEITSAQSLGQIGTVTIVDGNRKLLYTPQPNVYGSDRVVYAIKDNRLGTARAFVDVRIVNQTMTIDTVPAGVRVFTSASGQPDVQLLASAKTSHGAITRVEFFANNVKIGDAGAPAGLIWQPTANGYYRVFATALSDSGFLTRSETITIAINPPAGTDHAPEVRIDLTDEQILREGTIPVRGLVADSAPTLRYRLDLLKPVASYAEEPEASMKPLANLTPGTLDPQGYKAGGVADGGVLGTLDGSMLANGVYVLRLTADTGLVPPVSTEVRIVIDNQVKIGQLAFQEQDLLIPVAGIPISVVRSYDSFNTNAAANNFGVAWSLGVNDLQVELDEERQLTPVDYEDPDPNGTWLSMRVGGGRNVTLTLPDGRRATFVFSLEVGQSSDGTPCFCYEAKWKAPPGVFATLVPQQDNRLQFIPYQEFIGPYWAAAGPEKPFDSFDFDGFWLTNVDGTVYEISRDQLYSQEIELPPIGYLMQSVMPYGPPRLTAIQTSAGDRLEIGNIISSAPNTEFDVKHIATGQSGTPTPTTSIVFKRDVSGRVSEIYDPISLSTNPRGVPAVIYEYYGTGEPNGANGNLKRVRRLKTRGTTIANSTYEDTTYEYGNSNYPFLITAIINAQGTRTTVNADSSGRFSGFALPTGPLVSVSHDLAGRTETVTDAEGNTSSHQYDVRGNVVRSVNAAGETMLRTYDTDGNLSSETDAAGATSHFEYDSRGNRTVTINALNHTTEAQYNVYGQVAMLEDGRGNPSFNTYDTDSTPTGNLLTSTDAEEKTTSYEYDPSTQQLIKTTDPLGNITVHVYYTGDAVNDPGGRRGDLKSDTVRQLIDGNVTPPVYKTLSHTTYTYDANGNRKTETVWRDVSVTPPADPATTTYHYDGQNRLVRTDLPLVSIGAPQLYTETTYNAQGKAAQTRDTLGRITVYDYDARGNLIQTRFPSDAQTPAAVSRTVYDANNRPVYVQDRVAIGADPFAATDAAGTRTFYDAVGRVVRSERLWLFRVELPDDGNGLRASQAVPINAQPGLYSDPQYVVLSATETEYDEAGRMSATMDARGNVTTYEYDILGRRIGVVDALRKLSSYEYDENGNQTAFIDALGRQTTYVYDRVNRQTEVHPVQGNPQLTEYDALGRGFKKTDQENKVTLLEYDALGRLTAVTNALGTADQAITRYKYDGAGNLIEQLDANQSIKPLAQQSPVRFTYDKLNRRIKRQLPDGQFETFGHDAAGNLKAHTNFAFHASPTALNRHIVDFEYDALDRLKKKYDRVLGPNHNSAVSFDYNVLGQRTKMLDASRALFGNGFTPTTPTRYAYDKFNRLETIKREEFPGQDGAYVRMYSYDFNGNVTLISGVNEVRYAYDALNRLSHVTNVTEFKVTSYDYDAVGNLKGVKLPNGIETGYDYDALNRLTLANSVKRLTPTTTSPRASFDYATAGLSGTGKRFGVNETVNGSTRVVRYLYDHRYRLKEEKLGVSGGSPTAGYTYDKVGNRKQRTSTITGVPARPNYDYNGNDWVTSWTDEFNQVRNLPGDTSFDANGSTLRGEVSPAQTANDEYDYENRLTKRTLSDRTVELVYDGDGHRVARIVTQGGQVRTTRYVIDELNPTGYAQVLKKDTTVNTGVLPAGEAGFLAYVYGLDLISVRIDFSSTRYYGYDGHGSTRFLTDEDGAITDTYNYDAFGILIGSTENTAAKNNYLFAGEYFDRDLGQYYNRARVYNQNTGRFWTMDTHEGSSEDPLSLHKYLYAHADGVNNTDPSGNFTLGELLTTTATMVRMAAQAGFAVFQTYNRAKAAYDTIQDVALVAGMLGDGDVDEDESDVLYEMISGYVRSRVQSHAIRVVSGAGGRALGAAAGHVGRLRITKAAIQRTREWYRGNKAKYPDGVVRTPNGKYSVSIRNGFPDFSPYAQKTVTIKLTGSRGDDFDLADQAAGITKEWRKQQKLVWHHHQKLGRMELVPADLNNPASGGQWHSGGVKLYELLFDTTYSR